MTENNANENELANKLIEEAFADVDLDVDGTPCPLGDDCSMHHRVDENTIYEDEEYGRLVTYVGDYVVVTSDNPDLENPMALLMLFVNEAKVAELNAKIGDREPTQQEREQLAELKSLIPALYETCVMHVGADKAIADLRKLDAEGQWESIRFVEQHNEWDNFRSAHEMVVSGVQGGDIDVSKPALPKE